MSEATVAGVQGEPVGWELRAQVPPGWIELVAHDSDEAMLAGFEELLEPLRDEVPEATQELIRSQLLAARRLCVTSGMRLGGALLTGWGERATAWVYGIWVVPVESQVGLNPVGLIERVMQRATEGGGSGLASLLSEGRIEDFDLVDGRVGTSLYATVDTTRLGPPPRGVDVATLPERAGIVMAAVPMPGLPHVAALVLGAAPAVEERGAMAIFASAMAHSVHLRSDTDDPQPQVDLVDLLPAEAWGWTG